MAIDGISNIFNGLFSSDPNGNNSDGVERELNEIKNLLDQLSKNYSNINAQTREEPNWRSVGDENSGRYSYGGSRRAKSSADSFVDGIATVLEEEFLADYIKNLETSLSNMTNVFGSTMDDIVSSIGEEFTRSAMSSFTKSNFGSKLSNILSSGSEKWLDQANKYFDIASKNLDGEELAKALKEQGLSEDLPSMVKDAFGDVKSAFGDLIPDGLKSGPMGGILDKAGGALGTVGDKVTQAAAGALSKVGVSTAAKGALSTAIGAAGGPGGLALMAAMEFGPQIVDILTLGGVGELGDRLEALGEKWGNFTKSLKSAAYRDRESERKRLENANERRKKDIEAIVEYPFKVLEEAFNSMKEAWDANLSYINQTQGYSKADLQSLIGSFANRVRSEGLGSVVSAADFTNNLKSVLESGLSGPIAEEFTYLATKLNAAVPTQDFFQYAETYAAIAANAVKDGKSQSDAIKYASSQLELFASDIIYASRNLSGGFTTGLQSASELFSQASQIAIAARTNNPTQIAGVLTSVSAITGAIAPDLASSMVEAIYSAATGGNNSQLVALRSLAGINASNTEFLQRFAQNPQKVFADLFNKLAELQHMSEKNYMEVAEGLSNIFGISSDAFARVDFSYLAKAITNMDVSNASLEQNLKQLASGQSTLSAEQMKIKQINEYMIDEGLAYVLDNEVARSIQEHMWEEQLANAQMEATYSVNLAGAAMEALIAIKQFVESILDFFNPFANLRKISNLIATGIEAANQNKEVIDILEAGKVGQGNLKVRAQLTTYGKDLKLTNSYLSMITETQAKQASAMYSWTGIGKSIYASIGTIARGSKQFGYSHFDNSSSSVSKQTDMMASIQAKLDKYMGRDNLNKYTAQNVQDQMGSILQNEIKALANTMNPFNLAGSVAKAVSDTIGPNSYQTKLLGTQIGKEFKSTAQSGVESAAKSALEDAYKTQQTLWALNPITAGLNVVNNAIGSLITVGDTIQSGFDALWENWVSNDADFNQAGKTRDQAATDFLQNAGLTLSDLQAYFTEYDTQQQKLEEIRRRKLEEEFWINSQVQLSGLNTAIETFDKGSIMSVVWPSIDTWLADIDSNGSHEGTGFRAEVYERLTLIHTDFEKFHKDWADYYIHHTTYNSHLLGGDKQAAKLLADINKVKNEKDKTTQDAINALTKAILDSDINDLMDPTVQQNVFLANILQVVQGIFQQNNTQGKLKLPDAIAAMATGMTVVENGTAQQASSTAAAASASVVSSGGGAR